MWSLKSFTVMQCDSVHRRGLLLYSHWPANEVLVMAGFNQFNSYNMTMFLMLRCFEKWSLLSGLCLQSGASPSEKAYSCYTWIITSMVKRALSFIWARRSEDTLNWCFIQLGGVGRFCIRPHSGMTSLSYHERRHQTLISQMTIQSRNALLPINIYITHILAFERPTISDSPSRNYLTTRARDDPAVDRNRTRNDATNSSITGTTSTEFEVGFCGLGCLLRICKWVSTMLVACSRVIRLTHGGLRLGLVCLHRLGGSHIWEFLRSVLRRHLDLWLMGCLMRSLVVYLMWDEFKIKDVRWCLKWRRLTLLSRHVENAHWAWRSLWPCWGQRLSRVKQEFDASGTHFQQPTLRGLSHMQVTGEIGTVLWNQTWTS